MKIFSYKKTVMDTWNAETRLEAFQPDDYKQLGEIDSYYYFSYNPETVILAENDEVKYEIKMYDITNKTDADFLETIKNQLTYVKEEVLTAKSKLFESHDIFDLISGVASKDSNILEFIASIDAEVKNVYIKYGFVG